MKCFLLAIAATSLFCMPLHAAEMTEHDHAAMEQADDADDSSVSYGVEITSPALLTGKKPNLITFTLSANDEPVTLDALTLVHTKKIHALLVDPTLTDYQHLHPVPTGNPGEYSMNFTPKTDRPYMLWLDITPVDAPQLYLETKLEGRNTASAKIDRRETRTASLGGYHFVLTFEEPTITHGNAVMGHVTVTDHEGHDVTQLQPVMGAFAHIVGIYDDGETIAHMHPMGVEPTDENARGGPQLDFHFEPKKPGFVKLFAQVNIDGKELFAPFGLVVK